MTGTAGENSRGHGAKRKSDGPVTPPGLPAAAPASVSTRIIGSLRDALLAAGRDDGPSRPPGAHATPANTPTADVIAMPVASNAKADGQRAATPAQGASMPAQHTTATPSAEEAARLARGDGAPKRIDAPRAGDFVDDGPPTTRVMRAEKAAPQPAPVVVEAVAEEISSRTVLVRGKRAIERSTFERDPVVGFLVVVGGPGLGAFRPVFEGNNAIGRATSNRIALDFGDESISAEQQAFIRYDSNDRSFLFVPNLAKTNVVSVNDQRPTSAVSLTAMDVLTFGRTQVAFVPFCGDEFDWGDIAGA